MHIGRLRAPTAEGTACRAPMRLALQKLSQNEARPLNSLTKRVARTIWVPRQRPRARPTEVGQASRLFKDYR